MEQIASVPWACCYLIYACERVRDYERAAQWCEQMKEYTRRFQIRCALGICQAHYASVMLWRGKWQEAETELHAAIEDLQASRPPWVAEAIVRLAELRRRQGRLEEAASLFERAEGHTLALLGRAELALDQGRPREAENLVEQFLRHLAPENMTQQAPAFELAVRVQVALGDHARSTAALGMLQSISAEIGTPPLRASARFVEGILASAGGDYDTARQCLEDAAALFERSGAPYETARARIELAGALFDLGRAGAALREALLAQSSFKTMGAFREIERAAGLLERLEPRTNGHVPNTGDTNSAGTMGSTGNTGNDGTTIRLTPREIEVLRLVAEGQGDREIATQLVVSEHTVHRHISNVLAKLDVPSRAAAVALAARHGVI